MAQQYDQGRHPLGLGRAYVVLRQHVEHGGPGHACNQRHVGHAQRQRWQDDRAGRLVDALRQRPVALHGQPLQFDGEDVDQQVADQKPRHCKAQHRKTHHESINEGARLPGRQHAHGNGQKNGHHQGRCGQHQRRLEPLFHQGQHRQIRKNRGSQVASKKVRSIDTELHMNWLVQTELGTDAIHRLGRSVVTGDDGRRIAWGQVKQQENEKGYDHHDGNRCKQPSNDVCRHLAVPVTHQGAHFFSMFHIAGIEGMVCTPESRSER